MIRELERTAAQEPGGAERLAVERGRRGLMSLWKLEWAHGVPIPSKVARHERVRPPAGYDGAAVRASLPIGYDGAAVRVPPLGERELRPVMRELCHRFSNLRSLVLAVHDLPRHRVVEVARCGGTVGCELVYLTLTGFVYWLDPEAWVWRPAVRVSAATRPALVVRAADEAAARQWVKDHLGLEYVYCALITVDGEPGVVA